MFRVLTSMADWRATEFNAQDLANTAWAFATVGSSDEKLFVALASTAERRVSEFDVQSLANTAWAFTTLDRLGKK